MKIALVLGALLAAPLAAQAAAGRTKIAVMDIRSIQGVTDGTATILSDIIVSEVARFGYEVVSKSDIAAMVGFEKEKQILGCSEDSRCLAEIGGALGVDFMLTGQVGQIGSRYRISLLLVDSRRARVASRSAQFCDRNEDALATVAQTTVTQLLEAIRRDAAAQAVARAAEPTSARPAAPVSPPVQAASPRPTPVTASARPDLSVHPERGAAGAKSKDAAASGPNRTPAYIALGTSGAFLLGGIVLGVVAKAKYDALAKQQTTSLDYPALYDRDAPGIRRTAGGADLCYLAAVISGGVGGWLWFRAPAAQVQVTPVASAGQVGLVAAGNF